MTYLEVVPASQAKMDEEHVSLAEILAAVVDITKEAAPHTVRQPQIEELKKFVKHEAKRARISAYDSAMRMFVAHAGEIIDTLDAMDEAEAAANA